MKYAITFVLGAAAGSLVTWKIVEKKYKELADEEIESVVERYKSRYEPIEENKEAEQIKKENKDKEVEGYKNILRDMDYTPDNDYTVYTEPLEEVVLPNVITPEEFGEMSGYETKSWTVYSDFTVTDENDKVVEDVESIIGEALDHIGEYADDAVYVRNDVLECDYEILKHEKSYSEAFRDFD